MSSCHNSAVVNTPFVDATLAPSSASLPASHAKAMTLPAGMPPKRSKPPLTTMPRPMGRGTAGWMRHASAMSTFSRLSAFFMRSRTSCTLNAPRRSAAGSLVAHAARQHVVAAVRRRHAVARVKEQRAALRLQLAAEVLDDGRRTRVACPVGRAS